MCAPHKQTLYMPYMHGTHVSFLLVKAYECVYSVLSTPPASSNRDYFTELLHLGLVYLFLNETVIKSLISNALHCA